ncbi:hypothetical protein GCM10010912_11320 [Paenibacillus albidus]|uniref:Uncharacterized protein n=1 Tax=Paenibacillus albidus TaxID=2041023 RepID=A0A917FDN2_9BACL|nr:hypothetical protein GCM10010912_11320 [Paenibacillus albidus]
MWSPPDNGGTPVNRGWNVAHIEWGNCLVASAGVWWVVFGIRYLVSLTLVTRFSN